MCEEEKNREYTVYYIFVHCLQWRLLLYTGLLIMYLIK